jgi:hypothetical protein
MDTTHKKISGTLSKELVLYIKTGGKRCAINGRTKMLSEDSFHQHYLMSRFSFIQLFELYFVVIISMNSKTLLETASIRASWSTTNQTYCNI